jgi:sterol 24-C-methyltransferase
LELFELQLAKGQCSYFSVMQADFMKMPFDDNTSDVVYAIEATCHAPDPVIRFKLLIKLSFLL